MTWVESVSASFTARHDETATDDARQVLQSLERTRRYLEGYFPRTPGEVTLVLHGGPAGPDRLQPADAAWSGWPPRRRPGATSWAGPGAA